MKIDLEPKAKKKEAAPEPEKEAEEPPKAKEEPAKEKPESADELLEKRKKLKGLKVLDKIELPKEPESTGCPLQLLRASAAKAVPLPRNTISPAAVGPRIMESFRVRIA